LQHDTAIKKQAAEMQQESKALQLQSKIDLQIVAAM
jgi:hypothetical protein